MRLSGINEWRKFKEMAPGLAANFVTGLTPHIDFAANLSGSFVDYPFPKSHLLELRTFCWRVMSNAQFKLVTEDYWLIPYVEFGLGGHVYKSYWGAYLPIRYRFAFKSF
jgi:hypothetical protein